MILEPEILQSYRHEFEEQLHHQSISGAVKSAQNLSAGRAAQILTNNNYDLVIEFLEKEDEKMAGKILSHFNPEMSAEILGKMDPKIGSTLPDDIPIDNAADIMQFMDQDEAGELFE